MPKPSSGLYMDRGIARSNSNKFFICCNKGLMLADQELFRQIQQRYHMVFFHITSFS